MRRKHTPGSATPEAPVRMSPAAGIYLLPHPQGSASTSTSRPSSGHTFQHLPGHRQAPLLARYDPFPPRLGGGWAADPMPVGATEVPKRRRRH